MQSAPKLYNHIPDLCLVGSIAFAFIIARVLPDTVIVPGWIRLIGWMLLVVSLAAFLVILTAMKRQGTSINPIDAPSQLITSGPFAISRNPVYLANVMAATGAALASGSWLAFVAPIVSFLFIDRLIIPLEETQMQRRFGREYADYARRVRRWLQVPPA